MRAVVCHSLSSDRSGLCFERDWPEPPTPGPGEVTVALDHAALNYPDLLMLSGGYQFLPKLPFIPGVEGAGRIVAIGDAVDPAQLGRSVVVGAREGTLAERITLPATAVRPLPAGLDALAAAGFTVGMLTAYVALVRRGRLVAGERLVCTGAGGGTGLAAVAIGKALGATVVAVASTPAKLDAARAAGADELILAPRAGGAWPEFAPVDVVFDPVGGVATPRLLARMRQGGRYLVIGFVAGIAEVGFDAVLAKAIEVIGVRAGEFARRDPAAGIENLAAIDALGSRLTPHIGLRVGLADAEQAFAAMAEGTLVGKAIIDCAV